jgi:hypothetical protein
MKKRLIFNQFVLIMEIGEIQIGRGLLSLENQQELYVDCVGNGILIVRRMW